MTINESNKSGLKLQICLAVYDRNSKSSLMKINLETRKLKCAGYQWSTEKTKKKKRLWICQMEPLINKKQ